jgi:hypothetical protein
MGGSSYRPCANSAHKRQRVTTEIIYLSLKATKAGSHHRLRSRRAGFDERSNSSVNETLFCPVFDIADVVFAIVYARKRS